MAKKRSDFNLFKFLFGSVVADIIILINVGLFYFLYFTEIGARYIEKLVLYPGNLMKGKIWCVITSGFIHGGWSHLIWNMVGVFIFARIVEKKIGARKTFFIYFGALILSMIFSTVVYFFFLHKSVAIIGASGAVMGLISAAMLLSPFSITYEMILPIPTMIKAWMFFYADLKGVLSQVNDGVSHLAHIFGFLSIAILIYFLSDKEKDAMKTGMTVNLVSFAILLLLNYWLQLKGLEGFRFH